MSDYGAAKVFDNWKIIQYMKKNCQMHLKKKQNLAKKYLNFREMGRNIMKNDDCSNTKLTKNTSAFINFVDEIIKTKAKLGKMDGKMMTVVIRN